MQPYSGGNDRTRGAVGIRHCDRLGLRAKGASVKSPRRRPKQSSVRASVAALAVAALLAGVSFLGGCSAQKKASGWFGGGEGSEGGAGQRYYAAAAGLTVYSEPTSSSKVVGKLSLHERVTRHKVTRGYAYVKADASGLEGWVNNSMLIWRLPAAPAAKPADGEPAEPPVEAAPPEAAKAPPEAPEAPPEAVEAPAAPESPAPAPPPAEKPPKRRRTGASIFDPY